MSPAVSLLQSHRRHFKFQGHELIPVNDQIYRKRLPLAFLILVIQYRFRSRQVLTLECPIRFFHDPVDTVRQLPIRFRILNRCAVKQPIAGSRGDMINFESALKAGITLVFGESNSTYECD